jgi:hypothetical protein
MNTHSILPSTDIRSFYCTLFCLSSWDLPNQDALCLSLSIFGKLLMSRGTPTWFETIWSYGVEAIDHWTIFSMKTEQNWNWKCYWNLGEFLMLLESLWQVRFNRVYFTIFRAKVWKIIIFEWFLLLGIQTNCKNCVCKENSVEPWMCSHSINFEKVKNEECVHI